MSFEAGFRILQSASSWDLRFNLLLCRTCCDPNVYGILPGLRKKSVRFLCHFEPICTVFDLLLQLEAVLFDCWTPLDFIMANSHQKMTSSSQLTFSKQVLKPLSNQQDSISPLFDS